MPPQYGDFAHTLRSLRRAEDELFTEWRRRVKPFLPDGAGPRFASSPRRLLFVLKEANDQTGAWALSGGDVRDASGWRYDDPHARPTWHPLLRWASYILDRADPQPVTPQIWRSVLSRIAVVNVKKRPGASVARPGTIRATIKDPFYAQLLAQQLSYYRPHVTICGGDLVGECVHELYGWRESDWDKQLCSSTDEIWFKRTRHLGLVLCFWHPAARRAVFPILREVIDKLDPR
jgi:hypothetical protein